MKLFKTIVIIVLAVLLTLSLSLNVFILTIFEISDVESFKQVLFCRELLESLQQTAIPEPEEDPDLELDSEFTQDEARVIYDENNVRVTFIKQKAGLVGPSLVLSIENTGTKTIDVDFTNVFINDWRADLSGCYCSSLDGGGKAIETLTLWESDYEDIADRPEKVEFTLLITEYTEHSTWRTILESEPICISLN